MAKFLITLLIIACIAPLFIKGPDGKPIMSLDDWKFELPGSVDDLLPAGDAVDVISESGPETVFKWQDEEGQWHFSSTPPTDVAVAEEMTLDGDINLMEAYLPPLEEQANTESAISQMPAGPMTVSPGQVKEMMETVTNLQETIDDRKSEIDAIVAPNN